MSNSNGHRDDNPIWTRADFHRAQPPEFLPRPMIDAFPKTKARLESQRSEPSIWTALRGQGEGAQRSLMAA